MRKLLAFTLSLAAGSGHAASIETLNIHVAPGHRQAALFINNRGEFLVSNEAGGFRLDYYLVRPAGSGSERLSLPGPPSGLNDLDQIIGSSEGFHSPQFGYVYQGGEVRHLSAPGCSDTEPASINNAGQIAVRCPSADPDQGTSFLLSDGAYTPIVVPGATGTFAYAMNQYGVVAGVAVLHSGKPVAFTFDHGTYATYAFAPEDSLSVLSINDAGVLIAQTIHYVGVQEQYHSFIVQPDGSMTEIVDPSGAQVHAGTINDAGQVTGSLLAADGSVSPLYYHDGRFVPFPSIPPGYNGGVDDINQSGEMAASINSMARDNYRGAYAARCVGAAC
jgi:hypothetical protein